MDVALDREPWTGGTVGLRAVCVLASNAGPMTLEGTNTWVLREPGARRVVVVDPGPDDSAHLQAVLSLVRRLDCEVGVTLLTHGHADHAAGAARFARLAGGPVRALDPAQRLGTEGLGEGDALDVDGLELRVLATPGHTHDSLCFWVPAEAAVLTGDTVLGRGTTVVAHPEGRLDDYLTSVQRLRDLAGEGGGLATILPGHGPAVRPALDRLQHYLDHRAARLEQVRVAVAGGASDAAAVVATVYADVDRALWPAAELSVRAQLDYLSGRVDAAGPGRGARPSAAPA